LISPVDSNEEEPQFSVTEPYIVIHPDERQAASNQMRADRKAARASVDGPASEIVRINEGFLLAIFPQPVKPSLRCHAFESDFVHWLHLETSLSLTSLGVVCLGASAATDGTCSFGRLIAPRAVAGGAGGFALVKSGGFAGLRPHSGAVTGRASDPAEAATLSAFDEIQPSAGG
jgi:hypothetical protein